MVKEIIAEAGVAFHNFDEAVEHISLAAESGCNAIKFQVYNDETINQAPRKWRQHLAKIQIDYDQAWRLLQYGEGADIEVFFTPMYVDAIDWLEELGVKRYKVRAKDNMNDKLLLRLLHTHKPVYISRNNWPFKQNNFYTVYVDEGRPTVYNKFAQNLYELWKWYDGYSCHCTKILAPFQALDLVNYVEVHTTLDITDKTLPDWEYSHSYTDMASLCRRRTMINMFKQDGNRPKHEIL